MRKHLSLLIPFLTLVTVPMATAQPAAASTPLVSRRVFFGHQSVGKNLLEGLQELATQSAQPLRIVSWNGPDTLEQPGFAELPIGQNEQPESKLVHFERLMNEGVGAKADIAFFKFCYIDFTSNTDVDALWARYEKTLQSIAARHPKTRIVHLTVPLTVVQTGPKAWLKSLLGKPVYGVTENILRQRFNEKLRAAYASQGTLFDLAKSESSGTGGALARFEKDGAFIPYLMPAYTDDGEHLNATGRAKVARELWAFLEKLP
jgi:hypothetical protein